MTSFLSAHRAKVTWSENLVSGIEHDSDGGGLTTQEIDLNGTSLDGEPTWFMRVVEEE